jgi:hypothetical protein
VGATLLQLAVIGRFVNQSIWQRSTSAHYIFRSSFGWHNLSPRAIKLVAVMGNCCCCCKKQVINEPELLMCRIGKFLVSNGVKNELIWVTEKAGKGHTDKWTPPCCSLDTFLRHFWLLAKPPTAFLLGCRIELVLGGSREPMGVEFRSQHFFLLR